MFVLPTRRTRRRARSSRASSSCRNDAAIDYLDGTVFGPDSMYVTTGAFTDEAPRTSDYTYMGIYFRSIRRKREDWLTARDYIWRWDTDWFWCSKHFGVQNPVLRVLATPWALNSRTYQRIMRLSSRVLRRIAQDRIGDSGRGHPARTCPGLLRFSDARDRHHARLGVPVPRLCHLPALRYRARRSCTSTSASGT